MMLQLRRRRRRSLTSFIILLITFCFDVVDASTSISYVAAVVVGGIFGGQRNEAPNNVITLSKDNKQGGILQPPPPPPIPPTHNTTIYNQNRDQQLHQNDPNLNEINYVDNSFVSNDPSIPSPTETSTHGAKNLDPRSLTSKKIVWSGDQQHQQQNPVQDTIQSYQEQIFYMHRDLEAAHVREQNLLSDLRNLSGTISESRQREKLHKHQLDVLTERVIDIETIAASELNELRECQKNCTELLRELEVQKDYTVEWREKCNAIFEQSKIDEAMIEQLQEKVKASEQEVESLATMIEKHRLLETKSTKKSKKKLGFFAWLFSFISTAENEDEGYEELYETARTSLLNVLQSERNSVNELEAALIALQQNNSVISEQVLSRDQIIDELNNRIAVFEEDKIVLKAALRQLQLEMNDEAPKTQKLVDELKEAQYDIERLTDEMNEITKKHAEEIAILEHELSVKNEEWKSAEANLTVIGTYVDKLEERLADFAVARRDMEERKGIVEKLEVKLSETESERDALQLRIKELDIEHNELKTLLSELVKERSLLQDDVKSVTAEKLNLQRDVQSLRQSYAKLDNEARSLRDLHVEAKKRVDIAEHKMHEAKKDIAKLQQQLDLLESEKLQAQQISENAVLLQNNQLVALESQIKELEADLEISTRDHRLLIERNQQTVANKEQEIVKLKQEQKSAADVIHALKQSIYDSSNKHQPFLGVPTNDINDFALIEDRKNSSDTGSNRTISVPTERQFGSGMPLQNKTSAATIGGKTHALVPFTQVTVSKRSVPLRKLRKFFSKVSGVHGLFTKPTLN